MSSENDNISSQDTFTLLRFHFDPFFLPKTELFFFSVHTTPFSDRKNGHLSNRCSYLSSKTHLFESFFDIASISRVFKLCRSWCLHQSCIYVQLRFYLRFHIAPYLGWTNVNAKPKTEQNRTVFLQKQTIVNWLFDILCCGTWPSSLISQL